MIFSVLETAAPLAIAGIGALISERAGVLNIGLEGLMLTGAFAAVLGLSIGAGVAGSVLIAALLACVLMSVMAFVTVYLKANVFIAGLGINLLAAGLVPSVSGLLFGTRGVVRPEGLSPPLLANPLADVPIAGLILGHTVFVYAAVLLAFAAMVFLYATPTGLRIRAAGTSPALARHRGISVEKYKMIALMISGTLAGIAGAAITLRLASYPPSVTVGRGWVALVTVYLGYRHPLGVLVAAALFGITEVLAGAAQGVLEIPRSLLLALPYLLTLVAMIIYSVIRLIRKEAEPLGP